MRELTTEGKSQFQSARIHDNVTVMVFSSCYMSPLDRDLAGLLDFVILSWYPWRTP